MNSDIPVLLSVKVEVRRCDGATTTFQRYGDLSAAEQSVVALREMLIHRALESIALTMVRQGWFIGATMVSLDVREHPWTQPLIHGGDEYPQEAWLSK